MQILQKNHGKRATPTFKFAVSSTLSRCLTDFMKEKSKPEETASVKNLKKKRKKKYFLFQS